MLLLLLQGGSSMYVRVKHSKTTYFLQCEPTDTVLEIKLKLQALTTKCDATRGPWQPCIALPAKEIISA